MRDSQEPNPNLVDHVIQKHILRTLVSASSARFSELKPPKTESNLFMYHLNQLIKRGVVMKDDGKYTLSAVGMAFVDRANLDKLVFRIQPKIVTILAIKSSSGNWLLLERLHEPHMNRTGFPSGKLHYGETLESAAVRELREKAGIESVDLTLRGNIAMRFLSKYKTETVNHTIGYVFCAQLDSQPKIENKSEYWRTFWGSEDMLLTGNVFKGHPDILRLIDTEQTFIESLDYISDY